MRSERREEGGTRQERRERRKRKQMEMRKHGANLAAVYGNAILKRTDRIAVTSGRKKKP